MKSKINTAIKLLLRLPSYLLIKLIFIYEEIINLILPRIAGILRQDIISKIDNDFETIKHLTNDNLIQFKVYTPNQLCKFRYQSFSYKEPEILEWINNFGGGGVFYDIGANIGLYSIYFAKLKKGNVYSFEPSVFNLRQLAKNISLNEMSSQITIIPNPLSNLTGSADFINGNSDEGGALSAFGVDYGYDGKPMNSDIKYNLLGFSLDDLYKKEIIIEPPNLIKIDVDGIEHKILEGAKEILSLNSCKSVYIEVNDDFIEQSLNVKKILEQFGFKLKEKKHSEMTRLSSDFGNTFNQIWIK